MTIVTELAAMAAGLQSDNRSDTANSKERIFFFITNYGTSPGKAFQIPLAAEHIGGQALRFSSSWSGRSSAHSSQSCTTYRWL